MKFKVGDKVRVKEDLVVGNLYGEQCFVDGMEKSKGKIFEIENISSNFYSFKGDIFNWTDEMLEEAQEKTFREVIAEIKEGEVWESAQNCFQLKEIRCVEGRVKFKLEGVFVEKTEGLNNVDIGEGSGQTFKLQRKQCSFAEAFKAYEEGRIIESCVTGDKYTYNGLTDLICKNGSDGYRKLKSIYIEEIKGKWYIND